MSPARWLPSRERIGQWLQRHPGVELALDRTGCLRPDRRTLARGIAVGTFVGLSPTVGFQTWLMLAGCLLLRGNFPAAFLVSWINNPLTMAPLYLGFNQLGEAAFGDVMGPQIGLGAAPEATGELVYLVLGSLLVALPLSLLAYALFLGVWRLIVVRRRRQHFARRARRRWP